MIRSPTTAPALGLVTDNTFVVKPSDRYFLLSKMFALEVSSLLVLKILRFPDADILLQMSS